MNLVSLGFIGFFLFSLVLYYIMLKKLQWIFLLIVSVFFYIQSDPVYLYYLGFSILTTYAAALLVNRAKKKPAKLAWLILCLVINIGLLFTLKYYSFGQSAANIILSRLGAAFSFPEISMIAPLGISFYTLQAVGYCVDIYRGKYAPEKNPLRYALFISFFPHIIQGPIARYDRLAPQLAAPHKPEYKNIKFGLQLALYGFFKKAVIADRVAILVNTVFNDHTSHSGTQLLIAALMYSVQIYADFSGCVDICRGVSQAMGIELDRNFNHPYFAVSIADFWRRWHISLSSWLRDYVYIPLGGNRKGKIRKYLNVIIVFFVSGMWHGVGLHYIVWGLMHGLYQVIGALIKPVRDKLVTVLKISTDAFSYRLGQSIITFSLVSFAWIFFRANFRQAIDIVKSIIFDQKISDLLTDNLFTLGLDWKNFAVAVIGIAAVLVISVLQEKFSVREKLSQQNLYFRWAVYLLAVFSVLVYGIYGPGYSASQFIYMQF